VCATLDAVVRAQGLRVGRYTSPHLVDFRERFLIDGRPVSPEYVVDFIERWTPTIERIGATFFEATTAMAFQWFADRHVDVAVIETGLGGRLDTTNVIDPLVAAVTSIGIDHVEQLGATREQIAAEKAGIFKPGRPAVIGEPDLAIATLLARHAREVGASQVVDAWRTMAPRDIVVDENGTHFTLGIGANTTRVHTPLSGEHQASNTTVALLTLQVAGGRLWPGWETASRALSAVHLPGRFHRAGHWIFDVAHNPDGARVLARTLHRVAPPRPRVAVVCVLGDKDWRGIIAALRGEVDHFVLTNAPTAPLSRSWDLAVVSEYAREGAVDARIEPDFDRALEIADASAGTALVTGSFHTVGDAMARLHLSPLGD
jgi:dihydrofolate synthase/folylpolyglutamate synthase